MCFLREIPTVYFMQVLIACIAGGFPVNFFLFPHTVHGNVLKGADNQPKPKIWVAIATPTFSTQVILGKNLLLKGKFCNFPSHNICGSGK